MQKNENLKSKTVRYDGQLIEQVMALFPDDGRYYDRLDFSDVARWGLVLVLAAHGVEYDKSHFPRYQRVTSARSMRRNKTIAGAVEALVELQSISVEDWGHIADTDVWPDLDDWEAWDTLTKVVRGFRDRAKEEAIEDVEGG